MGDLELIGEKPLTMAEVKEEVKRIEKRDKELTVRTNKTKEYLNKFVKLDKKKVSEIKSKMEKLNILRLKEKLIAKIIDIRPKDIDSLKAIFAGDSITFKQEDLKKVLACLE